jgi:cohesin loading factor subunit SCC2
LEKLTALLEDIFEAEDALPPDVDIHALPAEWFSSITVDGSSPLLHPNIIRKLAKYIGQVTRPTKRIRLSTRETIAGSGGTPRGKGRMAEVDTAVLSRVLKILDRSVRAGEDLDPFHHVATDRNVSPRKPKKQAKRPKAKDDDGEAEAEEKGIMTVDEPPLPPPPPQEATEADLKHLTKILEIAKDSVLAADCCIALLGSDRLTKQVQSPFLFVLSTFY